MARELVKWDYELRRPAQLETVVDRALALAADEPAGPVYLTLPREVLGEKLEQLEYADPARQVPSGPACPTLPPLPRRPACSPPPPIPRDRQVVGPRPSGGGAARALAEALAMPVFEQAPTLRELPPGSSPARRLRSHRRSRGSRRDRRARVRCALVPPAQGSAARDDDHPVARIPSSAAIPIRSFATDFGLSGAPRLTLGALAEAGDVSPRPGLAERAGSAGRARASDCAPAWPGRAGAPRATAHRHGLALALHRRRPGRPHARGQRIRPGRPQTRFTRPGSYFAHLPPAVWAGAWGGAGREARRARPHGDLLRRRRRLHLRRAHGRALAARAHGLPVLFIVFNNRAWNAVKRAVHSHAPDGWAVRTDLMPSASWIPRPTTRWSVKARGPRLSAWRTRPPCPTALPARLKWFVKNGARPCST